MKNPMGPTALHLRSVARIQAAIPVAVAMLGLAACGSSTPPSTSQSAAPTIQPGPALSLQDDYEKVIKSVGPSVVQIETDLGLGSGIVFDSKGDIVTNNHVVEGATQFTVTFSDGKHAPATLVGTFAPDDLAVIQVSGSSAAPATFANSAKSEVGEIVLAIGNPLGLKSSVSEGIISAVGRTVSEGNGVTLPDAIQTSAAINPGNSGGALVDLTGSVVGIPTLAAVDQQLGGAAPGIGFAIPSDTVKSIAGQLINNNGTVTNSGRAYLGVNVGSNFSGSGAVISNVVAGGPADKAGIVGGDTITAVNGQTVDSPGTLTEILAGLKPNDKINVSLLHGDGTEANVTVTLGEFSGSH